MDDKKYENDKLRKQIQFLTDVIENAKTKGQYNEGIEETASTQWRKNIPRSYNSSLQRNIPTNSGDSASELSGYDRNIVKTQRAGKGARDSLYHWKISTSSSDSMSTQKQLSQNSIQPIANKRTCISINPVSVSDENIANTVAKQNEAVSDKPSQAMDAKDDVGATTTDYGDKSNLTIKPVSSKLLPTCSTAITSSATKFTCPSVITPSGRGTKSFSSSVRRSSDLSDTKPSSLSVAKPDSMKHSVNTNENKTELSVKIVKKCEIQMKSNQALLREEIDEMHSKIAELRKSVPAQSHNTPNTDRMSNSGHEKSDVKIQSLKHQNVLSQNQKPMFLEKYKWTKVNLSTKPCTPMIESVSSKPVRTENCNTPIGEANTSNLVSGTQSQIPEHTAKVVSQLVDTKTPAKFIKKSKYSITRVKNSGKKVAVQSCKKCIGQQTDTPSKFITFSKYAIKRVRRSISGESKPGLEWGTSNLSKKLDRKNKFGYSYSGSVQAAVKVVRSKFKMQKVEVDNFDAMRQYKSLQHAQLYHFGRSWPRRNFRKLGHYQTYKHGYRGRQQSGQYRDRPQWGQPERNARSCFYRYSKRGRYSPRRRAQYNRDDGCRRSYIHRTTYNNRPTDGQQSYIHRTTYNNRHTVGQQSYIHRTTYNNRPTVSQKYLQRRIQQLKQEVPFNPKLRLDKRNSSSDMKSDVNFLMINGMLYKSNKKKLVKAGAATTSLSPVRHSHNHTKIKNLATSNMKTVTVRGVTFKVDRQGRSLNRVNQSDHVQDAPLVATSMKRCQISRVDIGGVTYMQTKPGTLERVGSMKTRMAAMRVVNKTVERAAAKYRKDNTKMKKKYCLFFNRFGKCNRGEKCPYIHDPEKIAVCTRFLRGTCKVKNCPFSHKASKDKMPVCSYFLKGVCNRDDCPYLHVNVNRDADICDDFLKGYCAQGGKCTKKHILKCAEYSMTGVCSKSGTCKLQHRKPRKRRAPQSEESCLENSFSKKSKLKFEKPSISTVIPVEIPSTSATTPVDIEPISSVRNIRKASDMQSSSKEAFEDRKLPAYISLKTNTKASDMQSSSKEAFKDRKLPAYISLKTNTSGMRQEIATKTKQDVTQNVKLPIKIRPQL